MTEHDLTITLTISQPSLQLIQGTVNPPSFTSTITFGEWIKGDKGDKGDTGDDGFSPVATVTKDGTTTTITITDKDGTTTAEVYDGVGDIEDVKVNGESVVSDGIANITVPVSAIDVNALPDTTKYAANIGLTINSSTYVVTAQLKDQDGNNLGAAQTIDLPLESVVVGGYYDDNTKKVVLTLQNGNTIEFSVADLVSGLQSEITEQNPLSADLITDGTTNKVYTATEQNKLSGIEAGAQVNVQSDWNENDSSSDTYIRNKPTIPSTLDDLSNVNIDHPEDYDALLYSEVHSKWDNTHLHPVAITGNYNSLNNKPTIPAAQVQSDWNQSDNQQADYIKNKPLIHDIPSGGTLGQVLKKNSSEDYAVYWGTVTDTIPSVYCNTRGNIAAKKGTCSVYSLQNNQYLQVLIGADNTTQEALTLNINSAGAKPIYINGTASSSSNYTLPNGYYFVFYDGTNYQFRTDGKLPMLNGAFGGSYNDLADKPASIPTPTSSDEGKLLSVDTNGNYTLVTILNSENIPY